jgi:hypothetical protein
MCFSPEMDLIAGVTISAVGIDTLRRTASPRQLALASLPLLFGVHQLVETFVWWELQGKVCHEAGGVAARIYLFIALFLVPIIAPLAFALLRTGRWPTLDGLYVVCGAIAGGAGLLALLDGPVGRAIEGHHLTYQVDQPLVGLVLFLYVVATCAPGLSARSRPLALFGIANLVAVSALAVIAQTAVVSLWCFWAAITSVLINLHLRRLDVAARGADPADQSHPRNQTV